MSDVTEAVLVPPFLVCGRPRLGSRSRDTSFDHNCINKCDPREINFNEVDNLYSSLITKGIITQMNPQLSTFLIDIVILSVPPCCVNKWLNLDIRPRSCGVFKLNFL